MVKSPKIKTRGCFMKKIFVFLFSMMFLFLFSSGLFAYQTGDKAMVKWKGKWYPATVKSVKGKKTCISYDGYSSSWDECVTAKRIKPAN